MKNLLILFICAAGISTAFAQKTVPEIKVGTTLAVAVSMQGAEIPVYFTVDKLGGPINLKWAVDGYGEGSFLMSELGVNNGNKLFVGQPTTGETKLGDTETFFLISKGAFKTLKESSVFNYNGTKFSVGQNAESFKVGNKDLDVIFVTSEDKRVSFWILNNPEFPFLVKTLGLPMDLVLMDMK